MSDEIQFAHVITKRGTADEWALHDDVLLEGEIGVLVQEPPLPDIAKVGDGRTPFSQLEAIAGDRGPAGLTGGTGLSAYEVWIAQGNTGSQADFIGSLAINGVQIRSDAGPDYSVKFDDGNPFLTATEKDGLTSRVKQIAGMYGAGARVEELTDDSGYAFAIVFENPTTGAWNLQFGIRDDGSTYPATGGGTTPILPGPDIVAVGDSLTQGAGSGGNPWPAILQSKLAAIGKPRVVRNLGVGGEQSPDIAARIVGGTMLAMPPNGVIPTSGSVDVAITTDEKVPTSSFIVQGNPGLNPATLMPANVKGNLTWDATRSKYSFALLTPGSSVTVLKPQSIIPAAAVDRARDLLLIWVGRNNAFAPDRIMSDIMTIIDHQDAANKRWLVMGVHNGAGEGTGTGVYNNIVSLAAMQRKAFGRRWIDQRRYMIDYGLAEAGVTPTAQDQADIAADITPTSLRVDGVHYNTLGYPLIAQLWLNRLLELGMI